MFTVQTADGTRYMVQLTGPRSYRFKGMHITRGGTLTVQKRTRDYLVKNTGFFKDFDPTPAEPIDEIFPPQFGDINGPGVDDDDFDMKANPPLTQEQAIALASAGAVVDQKGKPVSNDDLHGLEKGDMSASDLPKSKGRGGATASNAANKSSTAVKAGAGTPPVSAVKVKPAPSDAVTVE